MKQHAAHTNQAWKPPEKKMHRLKRERTHVECKVITLMTKRAAEKRRTKDEYKKRAQKKYAPYEKIKETDENKSETKMKKEAIFFSFSVSRFFPRPPFWTAPLFICTHGSDGANAPPTPRVFQFAGRRCAGFFRWTTVGKGSLFAWQTLL